MKTLLLALLAMAGCSSMAPKPGWKNTLGMKFVKVPGVAPLVCLHETRVRDYADFVRETGTEWPASGFRQGREHPAVNVSWNDAKAFCAWLSAKEGRRYRLPTDAEWSVLSPDSYPWGNGPLPARAGNYCDAAFGRTFGEGYEARWLPGYDDGYAATAPVGKFQPNKNGLYDLGGNVWEWCEDWYDPPNNTLKVLRGAAWRTGNPQRLLTSYRGPDPPSVRLDSAGFRLVVQ
ncbi:MAG: SUMF1/EgtB/PvdO family nonheme iron enzyme [Prosthecobacter sp.]|nr:SUMF1/EgtB/PvdO family nonheme iron enzyme [Prosthecobacter sp.]